MRARGVAAHTARATAPAEQARIWKLRESSLGLSMAMKGDAKSISFVEDTAVAPEKLRDFIARFLGIIRSHGTTAGVYAHASVGCLHVRPVVNMKTASGVRQFEAIATEIADLVLEFGGALSGEHGDGLVRGPFMARMFGPELYDAFRTVKRTFDPDGALQPGQDRRRASPDRQPALRPGLPDAGSPHRLRSRRARRARTRGRDVQRRRRLPQDPRRHDVPVVHGDARRSALDAGAGQRPAPGDDRRAGGDRTPRGRTGRPRRPRRARPVPGVPRLQDGVSGRRRHGAFQERVPRRLPAAPRHPAPGARARAHPRPVGAGQPGGAARQPVARARLGPAAQRGRLRHRPPPLAAGVGAADSRGGVGRPVGRAGKRGHPGSCLAGG